MKTNPLNRRNFLRFTAGIGIVTAIDNILPAYNRQTIAASEPVNGNKYPDLIKLQNDRVVLASHYDCDTNKYHSDLQRNDR